VLLITQVFRFHSTVAVAAATLVAAALFNPLRRRVQLQVHRQFNRSRYDAHKMVAAFAARLNDAVDLDSVREDLDRCSVEGPRTRACLGMDQPARLNGRNGRR
jgi:hypothetical protein